MKKRFLIVMLFSVAITINYAQYPIRTSIVTVDSLLRIAPNVITFSIYFKNTASDSAINYSGGQFHLDFNKDILNGGTGTLSIISSGLPANLQPANPTVYTVTTPGQLRLAPKAPPGALIGGFSVNPGDSVLVVKLALSTSVTSLNPSVPLNILWRIIPNSNPLTKISAYIWKSNQIISANSTFVIRPLSNKELDITALVQGFYSISEVMIPDTITVKLHNSTSPWSLVDQAKVLVDASGRAITNFFSVSDGTNYYLAVKHRNSVETWSANPVAFSSGKLSYDFTTASTKAYSDGVNTNLPMVQIGSKWCFWSGEVTNNYFIEFDDLLTVYNFYLLALEDPGYYTEDITGNGFVEFDDVVLVYNNYNIGVWSQNPLNPVFTSNPIKMREKQKDMDNN